MSLFSEILQGIPANTVLRERVKLAEERYDFMSEKLSVYESEIQKRDAKIVQLTTLVEELREKISSTSETELMDQEAAILVHLYREADKRGCSETTLATIIRAELGTTRYHIGRLRQSGYVRRRPGIAVNRGHFREETFCITQSGRAMVAENELP